jgi:hypothetical protein
MSDRGILFCFSLFVIVGSLGVAVWLAVTGQAGTIDGLFLVLTALLTALAFALFLKFLIRRAMETAAQKVSPAAKTEPAKPARKVAPATVSES